ncbi:MAG: ABC transporter permease, partial [Caldisericum exile]
MEEKILEEEIEVHETFLSDSLKSLKKNKSAIVGLVIISILVITAILAPVISPHNPIEQDLYNNLKPGIWAGNTNNILGTDEFGRDILSRIIYGARVSLTVGVIAVIIGVFLGGIAGIFSGFYGGWVDNLIGLYHVYGQSATLEGFNRDSRLFAQSAPIEYTYTCER